eukprot:CAMPEP_0197619548 /NCGR_PEP_ID=MMETSP1338-20131121/551_1 /TAXON_ID=43686 ORGANISM="Pelagodinium beii, Strain RCC1491" /NCGR_SAMPLE_ID=MMETSP1338 /ASSEMBLY_ACC=CAM_ASM_000754 /LENGTH=864 /DNA_ID=CAMNT_0043188529 /DNA_START=144 /DNA_END=2738 /DNA_ORIENTATION=-
MASVWQELRGELALILLFSMGFLLFRLLTQHNWFQPGLKEQKFLKFLKEEGQPKRAAKRRGSESSKYSYLQRIRKAIEKQSLKDALSSIASMHYAEYAVPGSCLASLLQLASSKSSALAGVEALRQLPRGVFSAENVVTLAQYAANVGHASLVRQVHAIATEAGLELSNAACEALLRGYAVTGDSNAVQAFKELRPWQPSESFLASVVPLCAESRSVCLAEHLVEYSRQHYSLSLPVYAALIKVYTHSKMWDKACSLHETMAKEGLSPDAAIYGALIKAAVESGRSDLAKQLFQDSSNPDVLNYMSMIRSAGRESDVAKALHLLGEYEKSTQTVEPSAYNCALEVCVAAGDKVAAKSLLSRMEKGGHVDVVSYNTYMKLLHASGAAPEVRELVFAMRSRGIEPSIVTYNSMIKEAARNGIKEAWKFVEDMEHSGVKPDAFTCSILMAAIKHAPSSEAVDKIMHLMERNSVLPDEVLLNCMLDVCVRLGEPARLRKVLQCRASTVPSPHSCATLIRAYGHAQQLDQAWVMWRKLSTDSRANEESFVAMVQACLASQDLPAAVKVFGEMHDQLSKFPRSSIAFSLTVKTALHLKQVDLAMTLYGKIREIISMGPVTYNSLIDAVIRDGQLDTGMGLYKDMVQQDVAPDLITYSILIKGHASSGNMEAALSLLRQMQSRGIAPDAILFNSILNGSAQNGQRALTEKVLEDMKRAGIPPSNFTLSILVKLYGRCGDLDTALKVTEMYPAQYGFHLNAQVYTCLMSTFISGGSLARAFQVYRKMVSAGCAPDAKVYETILSGCLRYGEPECAAQVLKDLRPELKKHRLKQDLLESVVGMARRRGRPDLATEMSECLKGRAERELRESKR